MLLFKLIIVILLIFIVISLFTALYLLMKSPDNSLRVVKSLAIRVGLSLFVMLLTFAGVVLLEDFLSEHVWLFAGYWFVTSGLVVFLLLLAIYDMLRVRSELSEGRLKGLRDLEKFVEEIKEKDDTRD